MWPHRLQVKTTNQKKKKTTNPHSWGRGKIYSLTVIVGNFKPAMYLIDDIIVY